MVPSVFASPLVKIRTGDEEDKTKKGKEVEGQMSVLVIFSCQAIYVLTGIFLTPVSQST